MFKFIFDLATEPLGLPIEWYYEWSILGVIGYIEYLIAYNKVGSLYRGDFISGRATGSFFHRIIRTIYFIVMWAVTYGVIWVGKFIVAHKVQVAIGVCSIIAVVIVAKFFIWIKDYSSCNPIQISVYEDKIYIWNDGEMPPNLDSTDKLFMKHSSKPYNPKLANVFFKSGMIEAWGRGFEKIKEACGLYDGPLPEYEINESGIMVLCKACDRYIELLRNDSQHPNHYPNQNGQDVNRLIIDFCREPRSVQEIMDKFDFDSRTSFRRKFLTPMLKKGVLKMTIPEKPSSKNQKYFS